MNKKALLLFSGGLDSMLAAEILKEQKVKIVPICFESFFFNCSLAKKSAHDLNLKLRIVDISDEHLKVIRNPRHGRGKGLNPCIDCHLLMMKKAKQIMIKEKYDFLATGEVLDERPFSQSKKVFRLAEEGLKLRGLILRPLSALLLPETVPESKGWVKREDLHGIKGKPRKTQIALAKKFKVKKFPTPSGGCILTELDYSGKLKKLFEKVTKADGLDCQTLRRGRVFWENGFLLVVGRNEKDNQELLKIKKKKDIVLEPDNFSGPTVLIRGFKRKITKQIIDKGIELLLNHSKKIPQEIIIKVN